MDNLELADVVDTIEEYVQGIGYPNTEQIELPPPPEEGEDRSRPPESGMQVIIVDVETGPSFTVIAKPETEYFKIQSTYPLWQDLAEALTPDAAKEFIPDEIQADIPEDHPIRSELAKGALEDEEHRLRALGAFELLRRVDLDIRKDLVYQLSRIFTRAEVKHFVGSPDSEAAPHEFMVEYKIFPYSDQFGYRELNDAIERVRMAAQRGTLYLRYAFNLGVDLEGSTAGEIDSNPDPPGEIQSLEDRDGVNGPP